ncbi:hypothetical protein CapIbe_011008 [Capra ibex]
MQNCKAIDKIQEGMFSEVTKMQNLRDGNYHAYKQVKQHFESTENGIFHRDVKPEDILIKQDVLKLGDPRSCRSVYSKQPYMEHLSTCRYRAPECLLTHGFYSYTMDLWTADCELCKMASLQPLFPRANELVQISRIHDVMGTPAEKTFAKFKHGAQKADTQKNVKPSLKQYRLPKIERRRRGY